MPTLQSSRRTPMPSCWWARKSTVRRGFEQPRPLRRWRRWARRSATPWSRTLVRSLASECAPTSRLPARRCTRAARCPFSSKWSASTRRSPFKRIPTSSSLPAARARSQELPGRQPQARDAGGHQRRVRDHVRLPLCGRDRRAHDERGGTERPMRSGQLCRFSSMRRSEYRARGDRVGTAHLLHRAHESERRVRGVVVSCRSWTRSTCVSPVSTRTTSAASPST